MTTSTIFIEHWPVCFDEVIPTRVRELGFETVPEYLNELCKKNAFGYAKYNEHRSARGAVFNERWVKEHEYNFNLRKQWATEQLEDWKQQRKIAVTECYQKECDAKIKEFEHHVEFADHINEYYVYNDLWCESKMNGFIDSVGVGQPNTHFNNGNYRKTNIVLDKEVLDIIKKKHKFPERYILKLIEKDCQVLLDNLPFKTAETAGP